MNWFHRWIVCLLSASNRVFGQIVDPKFENDTSAFEETFMGAMQTHNLWMTLKEHVLVYHRPEYVRRTGVLLGPTSEQALEIRKRFLNISCHRIPLYGIPTFRER